MLQLNLFDIFMKRNLTSHAAGLKLNIDSNDLFFRAASFNLNKAERNVVHSQFQETFYRAFGKINGNVIDLLGSSFMKGIPMSFFFFCLVNLFGNLF